jgi:hypothetical protein
MTVAIPEAAEAVGGGGAAIEPSAVYRPGRSPAGRRAGTAPARRAGGTRGGGSNRYTYYYPPQDRSRRVSRQRQGKGPPPDKPDPLPSSKAHGSYHRVVIAEFIVCVLLVGASPFLTPRTDKSKSAAEEATAALSAVSLAGPLVRLTALCIVFFSLALLSTGQKTGKIAAALGALVTLGVLLNATDMFTAISQAFGPAKQASSPASPASGEAS